MKHRALAAAAVVVAIATVLLGLPSPATALPAKTPHYPDLITLKPTGVRLDTSGGLRRLFFSNTIGNEGDGPLELRPENNASTQTTDAIQEIYSHPATSLKLKLVSSRVIGTFIFHPAHNHWHMEDFANYGVYAINGDGSTGALLASTEKISFCMIDTDVVDSSLEHFNWGRPHSCGRDERQGLRVGRGDTYSSFLPDQFVDITGLPNGNYRLISMADPVTTERPNGRISEVNDTNNAASVDVHVSTNSAVIVPGSERGVVMTAALGDAAEELAARNPALPHWCELASPSTTA
jgi:hypothetical protein